MKLSFNFYETQWDKYIIQIHPFVWAWQKGLAVITKNEFSTHNHIGSMGTGSQIWQIDIIRVLKINSQEQDWKDWESV